MEKKIITEEIIKEHGLIERPDLSNGRSFMTNSKIYEWPAMSDEFGQMVIMECDEEGERLPEPYLLMIYDTELCKLSVKCNGNLLMNNKHFANYIKASLTGTQNTFTRFPLTP